jgi:hypothetical protein
MADLQPFITTIFNLLLHRLQDTVKVSKKAMYCKLFFHSICFFSVIHGAQTLFEQLDAITQGLIYMLVMNVWSENRDHWNMAEVELKQVLVGGSKILCETPITTNADAWKSLFASLYVLSIQAPAKKIELTTEEELAEDRAFDSAYSKLSFAYVPTVDPCANIPVGQLYFATQVAQFTASRPGQYSNLIPQALSPEAGNEFRALLHKNGLTIV